MFGPVRGQFVSPILLLSVAMIWMTSWSLFVVRNFKFDEENLRLLFVVRNFKFREGVLKRIPNIEMLDLEYDERAGVLGDYCLHNLHRLHKLQILRLKINYSSTSLQLTQELSLPYSLKELTLVNTQLPWEEMTTKIGPLPSLQILVLQSDSFIGSEWETFEGQFSSLKYLLIENCDLESWTTDNTHFPRLEDLVLRYTRRLKEIPSGIGDIPTLKSIRLFRCSDSVEDSARGILKEQEEYGNEDLQLIWHTTTKLCNYDGNFRSECSKFRRKSTTAMESRWKISDVVSLVVEYITTE